MKAALIAPEKQSLEATEIHSHVDIVRLAGRDTIESDALGSAGDRLVPVPGRAALAGADHGKALKDVVTDLEELRVRATHL
jgi:hypothetical protein